jgi:hypothetical protein
MALFGNSVFEKREAITLGTPSSGNLIYGATGITLGNSPINLISSNITAPNKYNATNLNFQVSLTYSSGASGTLNPLENAVLLTIMGNDGEVIAQINGSYGEFTRWQHRFNNNGVYVSSPTGATGKTNDVLTWNFALQHFAIPNSKFPITVKLTILPLASLGSAVSSATLNSFYIYADFVPSVDMPVKLRTKLVPIATGIQDIGAYIDRTKILDLSIDVATDTNLNASNSIYLAVNNNSLIPYSPYQVIKQKEQSIYPISTPHIDGFFPVNVVIPTIIDGNQQVSFKLNIATAPSVGGNNNVVNLYLAETY